MIHKRHYTIWGQVIHTVFYDYLDNLYVYGYGKFNKKEYSRILSEGN